MRIFSKSSYFWPPTSELGAFQFRIMQSALSLYKKTRPHFHEGAFCLWTTLGLAVSAKGGKKNVLPEMDFYIVLNKADDEKRLKMAERIALRVERDSGEKVRITSFR